MFLVRFLKILFIIFLTLFVLGTVYSFWIYTREKNIVDTEDEQQDIQDTDITVVAQNLQVPWGFVFLPDGEMLITQRDGSLVKVNGSSTVNIAVNGVEAIGEGGLLGIALHPDFESNRYLYLYFTAREGEELVNRVVRYVFDNDTISDPLTIVNRIPAGTVHNGGYISFGPDGYLYITTGDAGNSSNAQNLNSLAGKILRISSEGSIPQDNPFEGSPVYSYGHRNPQGLAWDDEGGLWSTEHGRSGLLSGYDEVNSIQKGGNYGWPTVQGDSRNPGMIQPFLHSGANTTWAPAGLVYYEGNLFFGGLRGQSLYQLNLENTSIKEYFKDTYGRIRAVVIGPDGYMYFSTSNLDGRGNPRSNDDIILKVNPEIF